MTKYGDFLFYYSFSILMLMLMTMNLLCRATDEDRKVYIVYMGSLPDEAYSPTSNHLSLLQAVIEDSTTVESSLVRSYKRSFNGFAAKLTENERQRLANMKEVVSVFLSRTLHIQTTRSWDFMGLSQKIRRNTTVDNDVIIGVIDSGIWPESESFGDEGFGPATKKWKGACKGGKNFTCNNKIIGARYYTVADDNSARDQKGHGSHIASIAAGNYVKDASFFGLAKGNARGGVPSARIAAYKVCGLIGCSSDDILAAFDDAIADGVDIITISIGAFSALPLEQDATAIGAFHAMKKGILTLNSAGNYGPEAGTVVSVAPWLVTVAASNIDRWIRDKVVLGNGRTLVGNAVNSFTLNGTNFPIIYGKAASGDQCNDTNARSCSRNCIEPDKVKGNILFCDKFVGSFEASSAGALGSIVKIDDMRLSDDSVVLSLPASALSNEDYEEVLSYVNSTENPRANILKSEVIKQPAAPIVASLSSRGPNTIVPQILKPDITAPGVEILAAFPLVTSPSGGDVDLRRVKYNILSGTSMSCPHAAGVAAYVKTFHPDWSPSAIKSSLMTTAWVMKNTKGSYGEFGYGSGHVDPTKAINPGLVYEAFEEDHIRLLCSIGYDQQKIRLIAGDNSSCPDGSEKESPRNLNYPSMAASVSPNKSFAITFHRRVKNVCLANSTYKAKILPDSQINVEVVPQILSFKSLNEEKSFDVVVKGGGLGDHKPFLSTSLVWSDGSHSVRSPIVVFTNERFMTD